jgi:2-polyprenyl-6-methoxyphenol hydroxylase-like FAD-dependent oxidoreductase
MSEAPEKIIIVGAGACGLAAAILLSREFGVDVTVFDALTTLEQDATESYPIGVNPRGLSVLDWINPAIREEIERSPSWITGSTKQWKLEISI